jgi:isocitrate dehydrogenase kinase/phosphatase
MHLNNGGVLSEVLRHTYATSIGCLRYGAKMFTQKFLVFLSEDMKQCLKAPLNLKLYVTTFTMPFYHCFVSP